MTALDNLTLERWDLIGSDERKACAEQVGRLLPTGFTLSGLRRYSIGDQSHEVAIFDGHDEPFALIPGGTVTLGYERGSYWPTKSILERRGYCVAVMVAVPGVAGWCDCYMASPGHRSCADGASGYVSVRIVSTRLLDWLMRTAR